MRYAPSVLDHLPDAGQFVYVHADSSGAVLYVGMSHDIRTRHDHHSKRSPWWPDVATIELSSQATIADAQAEERRLIHLHNPPHNHERHAPPLHPAIPPGEAEALKVAYSVARETWHLGVVRDHVPERRQAWLLAEREARQLFEVGHYSIGSIGQAIGGGKKLGRDLVLGVRSSRLAAS